jgi:putative transposase
MRKRAAEHPRFGYRRIRIYLDRDGYKMSAGRMHRLWRQAGLQRPRRRPRRKLKRDAIMTVQRPQIANKVWSYDFVFDTAANGQQIKSLTVVDEGTRECLAIDVAGSLRSRRVIEVLARLVAERGAPEVLRSDNGPEFVSRALLTWIMSEGFQVALIEPGKPWQNGTCESFNGKFRDECLSVEWFRSREEARVVIATWRKHYNEDRPHSSLHYLTPAEYAARLRRGEIEPGPRAPDTTPAMGRPAAISEVSAARPIAPPEPAMPTCVTGP